MTDKSTATTLDESPDGHESQYLAIASGNRGCGCTSHTTDPAELPADILAANDRPQSLSYVYAIGRVDPRFPSISVEKEFVQVCAHIDSSGMSDRQLYFNVLSKREYRYLARQLCWVFAVQGLDTYIIMPRDLTDFDILIEAIREVPGSQDTDVAIGMLGPIAPPQMCNGLTLPIVVFDQLYSFSRDALIKAIPVPEGSTEKQFRPVAEEVFERLTLIRDNTGSTPPHRALNYLAMRYPAIYSKTAQQFSLDYSLSSVEVRESPINGGRALVDVIFGYVHRKFGTTEQYFVRVDVTDEFPFLAKKLSPFYDRT